jgi:long-chain acyl-CoA synthetase
MDKVAIISKNRPEWLMVDAAVQRTGAILTPVYPTIALSELEFILNDAQVKAIFVNDEDLFHKVMSIKAQLPSLREVFTFEHVAGARHWRELLATPTPEEEQRLAGIRSEIKETDLATIIILQVRRGCQRG